MEPKTLEEMHRAHIERRKKMALQAKEQERIRNKKILPAEETPKTPPIITELPKIKLPAHKRSKQNSYLDKYKLVAFIPSSGENNDSPKWRSLVRLICNKHKLSEMELFSRRRHPSITYARFELWYLARQFTRMSLPNIAQRSGGVDHTTVMHGIRKFIKKLEENNNENKELND